MPTEEWFKKNPKVSAYVSPELNHRLEDWMKQRGIRKVSQAITIILEEHLDASHDATGQGGDESRLVAVEAKVVAIEGK